MPETPGRGEDRREWVITKSPGAYSADRVLTQGRTNFCSAANGACGVWPDGRMEHYHDQMG